MLEVALDARHGRYLLKRPLGIAKMLMIPYMFCTPRLVFLLLLSFPFLSFLS